MTTKTETPPSKRQSGMTAGILARAGQILFMLIFLGLVLFLGSGYLHWTAAWIYLGISLLGILINATFLLRTKPEMVAERGKPKEMKGWDKLVSGLMALTQYLLLPLVAALDLRFGWTREYSKIWQGLGGLVYAGGLGLTSWAMIANAYFSTAVRIQSDRGQTVCSTGPYHYVRHPGYVGFISSALGMAILLGSLWALIPAILSCVLIIIRTALEDRMLQAELPGYNEYCQEVKYRIIPGVW
jgi:protein-S-isoprenylcysteine O-methyltransferase Ste14